MKSLIFLAVAFVAHVYGQTTRAPAELPQETVSARAGLWLNVSVGSDLFNTLVEANVRTWLTNDLAALNDNPNNNRIVLDKYEPSLYSDSGLIFASYVIGPPDGWQTDKSRLSNDNLMTVLNTLSTTVHNAGTVNLTPTGGAGGSATDIEVVIFDISVEQQLPQNLYEVCNSFDYCGSQEHVECRSDGSNTGTKRCQCMGSYVPDRHNTTTDAWPTCYRKISYRDDPACAACEANKGVCYDDNQGTLAMYGCACPNTQSGDNCQHKYVTMTCTNDAMTVCFKPFDSNYADYFAKNNLHTMLHSAQPWLSPLATVHFKDKKHYPSCEFTENATGCAPLEWGITLSTLKKDLAVCNLNSYRRDGHLYFENTVIVDVPAPLADVRFNAFCSFQEKFERHHGLDVNVPIGGETGQFESAMVDMTIRNLNNKVLADGESVYEGDELFVRFDMTDPSKLFRAIRVEYCTASTHQSIGHPKAKYQSLLEKSCPALDQEYLTGASNFQPVGGDITELQNRPNGVRAFRLGNTDSFYIHCTVLVCQQAMDCDAMPCLGGHSGYGRRRKRRAAAASGTVQLTHKFSVLKRDSKETKDLVHIGDKQPNPVLNTQGQGSSGSNFALSALAGATGFIVFALFAIVAVLGFKLSRKQTKAAASLSEKTSFDNPAVEVDP